MLDKISNISEGGNVFTFLMAMEKVSFPEAVRQLAQKAGIIMPETEEDDARSRETEQLYHVNKFAAMAVAFPVAIIGGSYALARAIFSSVVGKRIHTLEDLMDRLEAQLSTAAEPPDPAEELPPGRAGELPPGSSG